MPLERAKSFEEFKKSNTFHLKQADESQANESQAINNPLQ